MSNKINIFFTYYLKIIVIFVWGVAQPRGVLMYKVVCRFVPDDCFGKYSQSGDFGQINFSIWCNVKLISHTSSVGLCLVFIWRSISADYLSRRIKTMGP